MDGTEHFGASGIKQKGRDWIIVELNKENLKKIRWLIAFAVLLYVGVQNLGVVLKYVRILWGLL